MCTCSTAKRRRRQARLVRGRKINRIVARYMRDAAKKARS